VQISVIVAITQYSFLRIDVGNGFVTTEFGHELGDPKLLLANALTGLRPGFRVLPSLAKGKRVKIPSPFCGVPLVTAPKNTGKPSYDVGALGGEFLIRLSITGNRPQNHL
jgi:hypothetical protein